MDIFRTALCVGLVVLLWNGRFRGVRPVRDFVLWGLLYPFHFVLMAVLVLLVWGVAGTSFGAQGLFLEDNPLTQFLAGAAVMLLFAALILHYSVLDPPTRWRNHSLRTLVNVLGDLNRLMPPGYPVNRFLRNGLLERLDREDVEAIQESIRIEEGGGAGADVLGPEGARRWSELEAMLRDEPFRLLVSPAILVVKGLMLVVLVGVVPSIVIPLLGRDPSAILERLPWLVGVVAGDVLGLVLACVTTCWAARAAGWGEFEERLIPAIRAWAAVVEGSAARAGSVRPRAESSSADGARPGLIAFLAAFFVVHFIANVLLPDRLTSRWIDWPERTYIATPAKAGATTEAPDFLRGFPWLPLLVLAAEALAAAVALRALGSAPARRIGDVWSRIRTGSRRVAGSALATLSHRAVRRILLAALPAAALLAIAATRLVSSSSAPYLAQGLWGFAFLGAFLGAWLLGFRVATLPALADDGVSVSRRWMEGAAIVILMLLYLGGAGHMIVRLAAAVGVTLGVAGMVDPEGRLGRTGLRTRAALISLTLIAGFASMLAGHPAGGPSPLTATWVAGALLVLGGSALGGVGRRHPSLLYPLTMLLGFAAFAIPYNALDEPWQAAMPAAGSIACMVALIAAVYTTIVFFRPKNGFMAALAVVAAVLLLKGNAWFVDPNEFKATFPRMETYYALPVRLNSRDYFRDTTPSTVRLRNRAVTEDFDRLEKQNRAERLATAYFRLLPRPAESAATRTLSLEIQDERGRLRAAVGDEIRLASEEWFTTEIDGDDCFVLAEEPFFQKIYRDFRYEKLDMIRDGVIRGADFPLAPAGDKDAKPSATRYRPTGGPGERPGLRLERLAAEYRRVMGPEADHRSRKEQYVIIAMYWPGKVASVAHASHLDTYTVEFPYPGAGSPLEGRELTNLGAWLDRCHLDVVRQAQPVDRRGETAPSRVPTGDCLVLEDARGEAPVPIGVYLPDDAADRGRFPEFVPFRPTSENLKRSIELTPPPSGAAPTDDRQPFTLRPAHDRGLFASLSPESLREGDDADPRRMPAVALYNAGRIRPGDRLILSWDGQWNEPNGMRLRNGGLFEVRAVGPEAGPPSGAEPLPAGHQWCRVESIGRPFADRSAATSPAGGRTLVGQWELLRPLNNTEVLLAWKRLVGNLWAKQRPKLVLVTVSGGGIRASVWTSVVLRKLEATLGPDFPYHIRLITGASGGMVGGSYYATSLSPPPIDLLSGHPDFTALHGTGGAKFVETMTTDQLDSVAGRLVFADLLSAFNPYLQRGDRGKTLEETWIRWTGGARKSPLARPLQSFAADERMGWRPSLVYTPMMVEDGRRILVSNLDLAFATRNVGGLLIEPSSRKIERSTFQDEDLDTSIHNEDDVFSLSSVEFYRLFPEAHDFRVSTATRMSASFPWVSPAINLPTLPPRRVVDAGYYDNYGVNLAALWLSKNRAWLEANTSGVVVVQIRDHVSQESRTEIDFDRLTGSSALDRMTWRAYRKLLTPALQAFSTPLLGISNARQWAMSFRNDEQVDLLDLLFDDERGRSFFRTVVFEGPVEVSLNWTLSDRESEVLASGFGNADARPGTELTRIKDYMTGQDSYEFHKWQIAHRSDFTFEAQLKKKYDEELEKLGCRGMGRLTGEQSRKLYENVVQNLKRLELLRDWWGDGHLPEAGRSE